MGYQINKHDNKNTKQKGNDTTTVRLEDDTTGTADDCNVGDQITVDSTNENGLPIKITGVVVEILEDYEPHQY